MPVLADGCDHVLAGDLEIGAGRAVEIAHGEVDLRRLAGAQRRLLRGFSSTSSRSGT